MTTESGELPPAAPASTAALVDALTALRDAGRRDPLRAARARRRAGRRGAHRAGPPARRLPAPPAAPAGRAAAHRGRRIDRGGQVDRGQQPGPGAGQPGRGAASDHPLPGAGLPSLRPALVLRRPGAARARPGPAAPAPTSRPLRLVSSAAMDPGLAFLDAPDIDSVVGGEPPAGRPAAGRRRPLAVRHHGRALRRRGAVGHAAGRRRPAAPRSPCCWTGCRRAPRPRWARTCRRCCGTTAGRGSAVRDARGHAGRRPAPGAGGGPAAGLVRAAGRGRRRSGPRWSGTPWTARCAACARGSPRWPRRPTAQVDAAQRLREKAGDAYADRAGRRSTRACATAPCCAARCWPGGRSSSAPVS